MNNTEVKRAIVTILLEDTAVDVAEAISMRKARLQDMAASGIHVDLGKIENLSKAARVFDLALAEGRSEEDAIA